MPSLSSNLHPRCNVRNEMGLSDGYAEALGEYIGLEARGMTAMACGAMVVTHSRRLAAGLVRGLGAEPTMLAMLGPDVETVPNVAAWIESTEQRSVEDLLGLKDTALERFRATQRLLDARD